MIRKDFHRIGLGIALFALGAGPVLAQSAADAIRTRHDNYRELGAAFKNVRDELKTPSPQLLVFQISTRQIKTVAQQQYGWFPAGSGPAPGVKTKALPEIWAQPAAFKTAQDAFAKQAGLFGQAVASNDIAKISAAVKPLGDACANCHKQFRQAE